MNYFKDRISRKIHSQIQKRRQPHRKAVLVVNIRQNPFSFSQSVVLMIPLNMGTKVLFLLPSCVPPMCTVHRGKEESRTVGNTKAASKTDLTVAKNCPQMCNTGSLAGRLKKAKPTDSI